MSLSEPLNISIWRMPHHAWGYIIHIGDGLAGDLPGGFFQSLGAKHEKVPELIPDYPVQEFHVSPEALAALARELDNISYSLEQHPFTPMLSGEIYGLRVSRDTRSSWSFGTGALKTNMPRSRAYTGLWSGWRGGKLPSAQPRAYISASKVGKHNVVTPVQTGGEVLHEDSHPAVHGDRVVKDRARSSCR